MVWPPKSLDDLVSDQVLADHRAAAADRAHADRRHNAVAAAEAQLAAPPDATDEDLLVLKRGAVAALRRLYAVSRSPMECAEALRDAVPSWQLLDVDVRQTIGEHGLIDGASVVLTAPPRRSPPARTSFPISRRRGGRVPRGHR